MMRFFMITTLVLIVALVGCTRQRPSEKEPIHLNPNMDHQPRYETQAESNYFEDGSAMRPPIEGTVARGQLHDDIELYTARDHRGELIKHNPLPITMELLLRGEERYNIYCSPCHSKVGDGKGILVTKGYLPPPAYDDPRLLAMPDGYFFDVMTNGIRNMPSYAAQIPVKDRWAIVSYVRALQRAKTATIKDIPAEMRDQVK